MRLSKVFFFSSLDSLIQKIYFFFYNFKINFLLNEKWGYIKIVLRYVDDDNNDTNAIDYYSDDFDSNEEDFFNLQ